MDNHQLLPCAFCGCTKVPVRQGNGIGDYWLECSECGAGTKLREDGAGNEKDWNRRPCAVAADAAAPSEAVKCPACGGNDANMPCAFPQGGQPGCPRDVRLGRAAAPKIVAHPGERVSMTYEQYVALRDGSAAKPDERAALPRYTEWLHLRTHGEWSNGVPTWARDHSGRMNDMTAAAAVIEELAASAAAPQAALTDEQTRQALLAGGLVCGAHNTHLIAEALRSALATAPTDLMSDKDTGEGNEA
ncbi:MAG: Lar family restriction alleviation protein [Paraburkholderia tropica]|nr:Lar family restriction alleviation protein [Paraburkholderia tropica]